MKNTIINQSVTIRDARQNDLPQLLSMVEGLAKHHNDVPQITIEVLKRDIFAAPPWIYVMVAEVNERAIGYVSLCPLVQLQFGIRGIDMHHLFVEKSFRGVGIGKLLIEASMQKAKELSCTYMAVGTHPDNSSAQAVYLACGFDRRDGSHPRFRISLTT